MKNLFAMIGVSLLTLPLLACQSMPTEEQELGEARYTVESQQKYDAIILYPFASNLKPQKVNTRLHKACVETLGTENVSFKILAEQVIMNPELKNTTPDQGVKLGQSNTSFSLSNTPNINSDTSKATLDALDQPVSMLKVLKVECTATIR